MSLMESHKLICITRHFSDINPKLLEIGYLDNLIELQLPTKEKRAEALKVLPFSEVQIDELAALTEYFKIENLYNILQHKD